MSDLETVDVFDQLPLSLTVTRSRGGGVTGLTPTVAVRRASAAGAPPYLDWADLSFKTAGWTLRVATLAEVSAALAPGVYQRLLDLSLVAGLVGGEVLVAEFAVANGSDIDVVTHDAFLLRLAQQQVDDLAFLRKHANNRLEEAPGTPGTLVLYDDDDVTPLRTWNLRDYQGNGTAGASGSPSRRSRGT
jgi:hypothetical protein